MLFGRVVFFLFIGVCERSGQLGGARLFAFLGIGEVDAECRSGGENARERGLTNRLAKENPVQRPLIKDTMELAVADEPTVVSCGDAGECCEAHAVIMTARKMLARFVFN